MKNSSKTEWVIGAVFCAAFLLLSAQAQAAPECTVMGEVVRITEAAAPPSPPPDAPPPAEDAAKPAEDAAKPAAGTVLIRLKETAFSPTSTGCLASGAQDMARKNTAVTVSLDVAPRPTLAPGEVVFVNVRRLTTGAEVTLQTFSPGEGTIENLMQEAQLYFDDRLKRYNMLYAIKAYLGVQPTVEALVPLLDSDTPKEQRLGASLLLILLAEDRQDVGGDALRHAVDFALAQSRRATVGSSITLLPGARHEMVNELIGILHDKTAEDPFATIVALGELGPAAARAMPDVIDRLNRPEAARIRKDGDVIFAEAVKKMHAEDQAAKIYLARADDNRLKDAGGPLQKGMCRLDVPTGPLAEALAKRCGMAR